MLLRLACSTIVLLPLLVTSALADPLFENVTGQSGIAFQGRTWVAAWGDVNGDGLPDLWVSKHNSHSVVRDAEDGSLYLNLGAGRFRNATPDLVQYLKRDMHGSAWADGDGDGDQDLAVVYSEKYGLTIFANDGGTLRQFAGSKSFGLPPYTMGRNRLWLDYDSDGRLDLYNGADLGDPPCVSLTQSASSRMQEARLSRLFHLTPAETRLALDILASRRRPEAATRHRLSVETPKDTAQELLREDGHVQTKRTRLAVTARVRSPLRTPIAAEWQRCPAAA